MKHVLHNIAEQVKCYGRITAPINFYIHMCDFHKLEANNKVD
jgi:hypothetical protein